MLQRINNQRKYIDYAKHFAETAKKHIWLGGSFLHGNPTPFSDVDISVLMDKDTLKAFICGYGAPIYISYTTNPEGIIIVIYEDGVAVDIEVIESINVTSVDYYHEESIKNHVSRRNCSICKELCLRDDEPYQTARLFHRSLIKYLGGKKDVGVSIANEIASYLYNGSSVSESDYKNGMIRLIEDYHAKYPLDAEYKKLCLELIDSIENGIAL